MTNDETPRAKRSRAPVTLACIALASTASSCVAPGGHLAASGPGAVTLAAIDRMEAREAAAATGELEVDSLTATSRWLIGFCTAASGASD